MVTTGEHSEQDWGKKEVSLDVVESKTWGVQPDIHVVYRARHHSRVGNLMV